MDTILYARHEHGGFPVHLADGPSPILEIHWPTGTVQYPSARQLVRALCNQGDTNPTTARDPGLSLARYFKLNQAPDTESPFYNLPPTPTLQELQGILKQRPNIHPHWASRKHETDNLSVFDLFGDIKTSTPKQIFSPYPWFQPSLSVPAPTKLQLPQDISVLPEPALGIDLVNRGHEVRKLLFAGFSHKMARAGHDPEDVLQEVYRGIIARNNGTCQFDPRKSSFGHYVHMVIGCVLSNYHRKDAKRKACEQVGMYSTSDPEQQVDAALVAVDAPTMGSVDVDLSTDKAILSLTKTLMDAAEIDPEHNALSVQVLPLLYQGYTRSEMAEKLHVSPSTIGKATAYLRHVAKGWAEEQT